MLKLDNELRDGLWGSEHWKEIGNNNRNVPEYQMLLWIMGLHRDRAAQRWGGQAWAQAPPQKKGDGFALLSNAALPCIQWKCGVGQQGKFLNDTNVLCVSELLS